MLRKLYDWVFSLARHRHATRSLAVVSFAESSFFPIPPDVMLAPMVLAKPERGYFYAAVCTIASVLGGLLGYAIGYFLEPVGLQMLAWLGKADTFETSKALFQQHGAWVILIKGLTPIPFKLITIASGIFQFNLALFIALCVVTRGARFFLVAFVLKRWGPPMLAIVEKRLALFTVLFLALLIGAFFMVKLIGH
ncbi:DedA family protein [Brevundimonas diminuta]|uniref:YqaA family protein n=1 Tax=Brevundimonas TaxID=41275 RepID=UPI00106BDFA1|nr:MULTISPECIES: YqaA family protein [Brevundimonas]MCO8031069.1 DedA family protein [Brevundimonas diminuta]QBQ49755.1 DedA family protein [Brevundimonas naejangsanensis]